MGPDLVYTNGSQLELTCSQIWEFLPLVTPGPNRYRYIGLLLAEKALSQFDKDPINEVTMYACMHTGK